MIDQLAQIGGDAEARLAAASTLAELDALGSELLGKRSSLSELKKGFRDLDEDERRAVGRAFNEVSAQVQAAVDARRRALEAEERARRLEAERLDLTETIAERRLGHLHLVTQTHDRLEDVFVGMGFTVAEGPEVETDWYNFQALNIPESHPARSMWDTLYVDLGPTESTVLRTHTSPVQIRVMESGPPPIYSIMPGRV